MHASTAPSLIDPVTTGPSLDLVAHADWSLSPKKRWICVATRDGTGWRMAAPVPAADVAPPTTLLRSLAQRVAGRAVVGLDAVLGLPAAWGRQAGVSRFLDFLTTQVHGPAWEQFWRPAASPAEIRVTRPFYPHRPGGARQHHLVDALGLQQVGELRRRCDLPMPGRTTPCPLFWTLGANQVGKATLSAWRELVTPALRAPDLAVRIWPFDGTLDDCSRGDLGLAEVYPGDVVDWLGLELAAHGGKRSADARARQASRLREVLASLSVAPDAELTTALAEGFGEAATGEDAFDAFVGALGVLLCVSAQRTVWQPEDPVIENLEGWILGREPTSG